MNCMVCNNSTKQIKIDTYECSSCGHIFRDFQGDSIKFHKNTYRNKSHKKWKKDQNEFNEDGSVNQKFHDARKDIVSSRINKILHILSDRSSIFDIGSGAGTMAMHMKAFTSDIECLEIADTLVNESRRLGFKTHQVDFLKFSPNKKFDLVTCYHVLEHVKDLNAFLDNLDKISSKYVVFEVPTVKCSFGTTPKKRQWDPPNNGQYDGHYHYFTIKSISYLFAGRYQTVSIESGTQAPAILFIGKKV